MKFKKLDSKASIPTKAHPTDAGFDLVATSVSEDLKRNIITYGTGIAVEIPEGHVGYIFPRSSVYKHQVSLANCVGVIDSSYRGEIFLKFRIVQPHISRYTVGDKIGQLIIQPYPEIEFEEVDELDESDRGTGGFGSTDDIKYIPEKELYELERFAQQSYKKSQELYERYNSNK